jgi:hypothetical protein
MFHYNLARIPDTLREYQYAFFINSRLFLIRMRNVAEKFVEKIEKHILSSVKFFFENRAIYEIMWKNSVGLGRAQLPRGLRRVSVTARLLLLRVRFSPGAWMLVCCECCLLSGRVLCVRLITVQRSPTDCGASIVCGHEASAMRRPWLTKGY